MNNVTKGIQKKISLLLTAVLLTGSTYAATFTATTSGNFSSSTTWAGGVVPSISILADSISIPAGVTVNLDNNLAINGLLSTLNVNGTLSSGTSTLTLGVGTISGTGTIAVNTVDVNVGVLFLFKGALTANTFNALTGIQSSAAITVNQTLNLTTGTLSLVSGGSLVLGSNATLVMAGGLLTTGVGGSVALTNNYNVTYTGISSFAGIELSGATLQNLNVNVNAISTVTLASNLAVNGTLSLTSGALVLAGKNLSINGAVAASGTGTITSTGASNLVINATGGVSSLAVTGAVGNFTVNTGASNSVALGGNMTVSGILTLQNGSLKLNSYNLIINGNIAASGTGNISSTSSSDLTIATTGTTLGALNFAPSANTVSSLNVNIGANGFATIASDLNINDSLNFKGGKLNIGSNAIVLGASGTITGSGNNSYIITTANGYLEQNITAGGTDSVAFPLGTSTQYAPANVHLNAGSASGQIRVGVMKAVLAMGTSGYDFSATQPVVNATWNVNSDITSNMNLNLQVMWSSAMEVNGFNRNAAYISHYTGGSWNTSAATAAVATGGMYSLQTTGLTSLSPFSVFDQKTATAIDEIKNDNAFIIYPNPTTNKITIQNSNASSEVLNMDIYDGLGAQVGSYKLTDFSTTISVENFVKGNYFVRFYNSNASSTNYFIKL